MGKNYRPGRLGEEIRKIASEMILRELKDPRLSQALISISDVDVTRDAGIATLYLSVMPFNSEMDQEEKEQIKMDVLSALEGAKGPIRREISKRAKLRHTPELIFKLDTSYEYGQRMDAIIDKAMEGVSQKNQDSEEEE